MRKFTTLFALFLTLLTLPILAQPSDCALTASNSEGPYYLPGAPFRTEIAPQGAAGQPLHVSGAVYASDCQTPLPGAIIDIWQADASGNYDFSDDYLYRGRVETDETGSYTFDTVPPGNYSAGNALRPAHIHIKVFYHDEELLTTQIYFADDPANTQDGLFDSSLIMPVSAASDDPALQGAFDFVLDAPPTTNTSPSGFLARLLERLREILSDPQF